MIFYKNIVNGFLSSISTNAGGVEITESDYAKIMNIIQNKPSDPEGYSHQLRADNMEWELVEMPEPEPIDEEAGPEDYEQALEEMGVDFSD